MLVIAHRGASGHAPENTLAAFRRANGDTGNVAKGIGERSRCLRVQNGFWNHNGGLRNIAQRGGRLCAHRRAFCLEVLLFCLCRDADNGTLPKFVVSLS